MDRKTSMHPGCIRIGEGWGRAGRLITAGCIQGAWHAEAVGREVHKTNSIISRKNWQVIRTHDMITPVAQSILSLEHNHTTQEISTKAEKHDKNAHSTIFTANRKWLFFSALPYPPPLSIFLDIFCSLKSVNFWLVALRGSLSLTSMLGVGISEREVNTQSHKLPEKDGFTKGNRKWE